jgi:hypothetical protein
VEQGYDFPNDYYLIESVKINNISISLFFFLVGIQVRWGKYIPKGLVRTVAANAVIELMHGLSRLSVLVPAAVGVPVHYGSEVT